MNLSVYLNFAGNTEEAINFYTKALNAPTPRILKFGDLPPSEESPFNPEDVKDLVLHSEIQVGNSTIKFSDSIPGMEFIQGNNMSVTLVFDDEEEITNIYNNLSEGATSIVMPLGQTMWAEKYAYFVDKFGTPWQLNYYGDMKFGQ